MVQRTLCFLGAAALVVACSGSKSKSSAGGAADAQNDASVAAPPGTVDPGSPRVEYSGRVDLSDNAGPRVGWGGTRIFVRFQGTALSVTADDEEVSDGGSRYDVTVDGGAPTTLALNEGSHVYDVAKDLAAGTHVVELARRTEPQVGVTQFTSFDLHGGSLLAPPAEPTRHIEFVGDSEMAGYGLECTDPNQSFSADTENETKTYPELVGKALNAEIHNLGYSGEGVFRNGFATGPVYASYYPEAVPFSAATSYDFSWKPDAIWVALGANDYDLGADGSQRPPPDAGQFQAAYSSLVDLIRSKESRRPPSFWCCKLFRMTITIRRVMKRVLSLRTIINAFASALNGRGATAKYSFAEAPAGPATPTCKADDSASDDAAFHAKLAPIAQTKIAAAAELVAGRA